MILEEDIKFALKNNELVYFYQPKISMLSGKICGAEALVRWIKPDGSIVFPNEFIPVAEECGLITEITPHLFKFLADSFYLIHQINPGFNISFNVSADDLCLDLLTEEIIELIKEKNIPGNCLDIEITESKLIKSEISVRKNMYRLVDAGIGINMDDFGNGYSSLNVLADYPFTTLKLDYELIKGVTEETKKQAIIKAAIRMAHLMDILIVAEGVESQEQYILLQDMGCSIAQGFWISRPMALNQLINFIRQDGRFPASVAGQFHMMHIDHILWYRKIVRQVFNNLKVGTKSSPNTIRRGSKCRFNEQFYTNCRPVLQGEFYGRLMADIEHLHLQIHDEAEKIIEISHVSDNTIQAQNDLMNNFNKLHWDFVKKIEYTENLIISGLKH